MTVITPISKEDFEKILKNYKIGRYKSHRHLWVALQNTVYLLKTTKGKFVLKIFESANKLFHRYEVKVMEFAQKNKVSTPKIIKTNVGESIFVYKNKDAIIQEFAEGRHPKHFDNNLIRDCANKIGLLNKKLLRLKVLENKDWKIGHEFYPPKERLEKVGNFDSKKELERYLNNIKKINKSELRKSIIHSDLCDPNMLVKNNKLTAILDWDDTHKDVLVYELAVFIGQCLIKQNNVNKEKVVLFLREYQKHIKLNNEEKKALYYFIKHRYLGALAWCMTQRKLHKDRRKEISRWIACTIRQYKNFDKISVEEFLDWC